MEKKRSMQTVIIIALSFAILFMSVGFAAYSSTLNINGTAKVKASKWSVHFVEDSYTETGTVSATSHSVEDLLTTYTVTLNKPGDVYSFTVDVINDGTFNATLDTLTMTALDSTKAKYLSYSINYDSADYTASDSNIGSSLAVNATKTVTVTVTYLQPDQSADLPTEDVTVTLEAALGYKQAA